MPAQEQSSKKRGTGFRVTFMPREFYRRNLPHWFPAGHALFLTARLHGSLPVGLLTGLRAEQEEARKQCADDPLALENLKRAYFRRFDKALDAGLSNGPTWLHDPAICELVLNAWHHYDGSSYQLLAVCLMPNHLHAVLILPDTPTDPFERVLQRLKRYTALHANRRLGRQGAFWAPETYDHVIRGDWAGIGKAITYTQQNPVKAGLCAQ